MCYDWKINIQFGLFKPLTAGNKTSVREDWHIQPIETIGVKDKKLLEPELYNKLQRGVTGIELLELHWILASWGYQVSDEEIFGSATEEAVKSFQKTRNLTVDGIVDIKTWETLYGV